MTEIADVILWGRCIGRVARLSDAPFASFEYDPDFIGCGVEPSPISMPVAARVYSFPSLPSASFHGLPGLLADSVPDKFGNAVIDRWLLAQGRMPGSLSPVERLCYTGTRGMGALEFRPSLFAETDESEVLHVDALAQLADDVLRERRAARTVLSADMEKYGPILRVGTSAGGARAKALIGWNEATGEVRSGQVRLPGDYGYWLIKFDGLTGNGDKEEDDKWGYGRVEYAYHLMAKAAGMAMTECRLWDGRHFMTRRFDRLKDGAKLHMQTLGALAHFDFNNPLAHSYEQAFRITRQTVHDVAAQRELFRRMVFNVLAWNCDDHVKNISYLMDRNGDWTLAPAYDVCYAYNPAGDWTSSHQMSVNGKKSGIGQEDLLAASKIAGLPEKVARQIVGEVRDAVQAWPQFAAEAAVKDSFTGEIAKLLCG
ncbi:MAG: type II toxin-antitoxin system HipA family toxin [bacterium]|nr:type II toxin-antitoxin system HipA family toxin [bacterium]